MSFSSRRLSFAGWVIGLALCACGGDDSAGNGDAHESSQTSDDDNNAGSDGGVNSGDNASPGGDSPQGSTPPSNGGDDTGSGAPGSGGTPPNAEPPTPILPDVDGETPLSELDEDELEQVCEAYLDTAERLVERFEGLCGIMGLVAVGELESPSDAEFQAACQEARESCRLDAEAAQVAVAGAQCGEVSGCEATVDQFNECQAQVHVLDQAIAKPLSGTDVPPCDEMSVAEAELKYTEVMLTVLLAAGGDEGVASLLEGGGACESIDEQCPEYSIPVDELGLPL